MRRHSRSGSAPPAVLKEQFQFLRTQVTIPEKDSESSSASSPELKSKEIKQGDRKKGKRQKGNHNSLKLQLPKGSAEANLRGCAPKSAESLLTKAGDSQFYNNQFNTKSPKSSRFTLSFGDNTEHSISGKRSPNNTMTQDEINLNYLSPYQNTNPQKSPTFRRRKTTVAKAPLECNIVLLGDLGVGKTAFAVRFVTKRYLHEYDPNLERNYERLMDIDGESTMIRLWDTVDKEWEMFVDTADAFVIMYDITSTTSFQHSSMVVSSIKNSVLQNVRTMPVLLAGNKKELERGRKVSRTEGESFSNAIGCSFMEVSVAMNADNDIDIMIRSLVKQVLFTKSLVNEEQAKNSGRRPSTAMHSIKSFLSKMK